MFLYQNTDNKEKKEELFSTNRLETAVNYGIDLSEATQHKQLRVGDKLSFNLHDTDCQVTKDSQNGSDLQHADPTGCNGAQCAQVELSLKPGSPGAAPGNPFNPTRSLLERWPSANSILSALLRNASRQEDHEFDDQGVPIISAEQACALADSLTRALSQTMDEYDIPEIIFEMLDSENEFLAKQVLNNLPKEQQDRLEQAVQRVLEE